MSSNTALSDPSAHAFWLASRGLGVVAMLLLSVAVGLGLTLGGRMATRPGAAAWLKTAHEAVTLTALGAIAGHGLLLLGDTYLHPSLAQIAVPFTLPSQPFWTGVGVIGAWLAALLGLSFYVRSWIGVATWKRLHRWTLLAYALSLAHTIGSGTDAHSTWLIGLLAASTGGVVALAARRVSTRGAGPRTASPLSSSAR